MKEQVETFQTENRAKKEQEIAQFFKREQAKNLDSESKKIAQLQQAHKA